MINKIFPLVICFQLLSCTQNKEITDLKTDSIEMKSFSERVKIKFGDYAKSSGYYQHQDSVNSARKFIRGPGGNNNEPFYLISPINSNGTIFTFEKSDSCIVLSLTPSDSVYSLKLNSIGIPRGKYLFKYNNTIDVLIKD